MEAIEIAKRAGMKLKIAAKVVRVDREYFADCVQSRAVRNLAKISRRRCHETFLRRFSAHRMASDYLALYRRLQGDNPESLAVVGGVSVG